MKEKILALLEQKKYPEIATLVKDMNPADAAVLLEELPQQSMPLIFRLLPKELAAPRSCSSRALPTKSWTKSWGRCSWTTPWI